MATISKAQVKFVRSLQQKKVRDEHGMFVAEGEKCVNELMKTFRAEMIIASVTTNLPITHTATAVEMEQMSSLRTPQGIIAVFHQDGALFRGNLKEGVVLALDGIQDPGNLGTIIRTCDWFGVKQIVCSPDTADCFNSKVVQATMGALARVQVHYTPLVEWLQRQDCPIYGTLLEGEDMYKAPSVGFPVKGQPVVIVMGNEGNGISAEVRKCITKGIRIPSYPPEAETSESLNVAVATAIVLAEFRHPHAPSKEGK